MSAANTCDCPDFSGPVDARHVCPVHGPIYSDDSDVATMPRMKDDPRYAEEACPNCGGDGDMNYLGRWDTCEWCNGTGMVYTQEAIRLQTEAEERESDA